MKRNKNKGPKILLLDIETCPILAHVWAIWDQNIGLNQIKSDWYILSWSAKWFDSKEIMYMDQSKVKDIEDDSKLLKAIWKLIDQADIIVTQNGKSFDHKKLNARFILNGMQPPSPFKIVDTLLIAKAKFGFTSNKLEYLSAKLTPEVKKLTDKDKEFPGFELWKQCILRNKRAWAEMKRYNKQDVLALEAVYKRLLPWNSDINYNLYDDRETNSCNSCGSDNLIQNGHSYLSTGKYKKYKCKDCGHSMRDKINEFSKEKRKTLKANVKS